MLWPTCDVLPVSFSNQGPDPTITLTKTPTQPDRRGYMVGWGMLVLFVVVNVGAKDSGVTCSFSPLKPWEVLGVEIPVPVYRVSK